MKCQNFHRPSSMTVQSGIWILQIFLKQHILKHTVLEKSGQISFACLTAMVGYIWLHSLSVHKREAPRVLAYRIRQVEMQLASSWGQNSNIVLLFRKDGPINVTFTYLVNDDRRLGPLRSLLTGRENTLKPRSTLKMQTVTGSFRRMPAASSVQNLTHSDMWWMYKTGFCATDSEA